MCSPGFEGRIARDGELHEAQPSDVARTEIHVSVDGLATELLVNDVDGDKWVYRRDRRVRRMLSQAFIVETPPLLAPEIVLLFKRRCLARRTPQTSRQSYLCSMPRAARGTPKTESRDARFLRLTSGEDDDGCVTVTGHVEGSGFAGRSQAYFGTRELAAFAAKLRQSPMTERVSIAGALDKNEYIAIDCYDQRPPH